MLGPCTLYRPIAARRRSGGSEVTEEEIKAQRGCSTFHPKPLSEKVAESNFKLPFAWLQRSDVHRATPPLTESTRVPEAVRANVGWQLACARAARGPEEIGDVRVNKNSTREVFHVSFPKARVRIYDVGIFMSCCCVPY